MRRVLLVLANLFVVAYALDASLSLAETLIRDATGFVGLMPIRNSIAGVVVVASYVGVPLLALTPKLPISVFLPLFLGLLWILIGAPPVSSYLTRESQDPVLCAIQLAFAAAALLRIRSLNRGDGWLFRIRQFEGPLFSARYMLAYTGAFVLLAVPTLLFAFVSVAIPAFERVTGGFVVFDSTGISLDDRRYTREGEEIRLIAMMHIGEPDAYREIFASLPTESTLILAEGVSDEHGVMQDPISYDSVARSLGLEQQQDITAYLPEEDSEGEPSDWPEILRADLDASDFAPETVEGLARIGRVWTDESPIRAFLAFVSSAQDEPEIWLSVAEDILVRRNENLVAAIDSNLGEYELIVVPWGALHLPAIEYAIFARGFAQVSSVQHRLISWNTVFAFLTR